MVTGRRSSALWPIIPNGSSAIAAGRPTEAGSLNPALVIRRVRGMGRGVFAARPFQKGEVIEVCPVVPMTRREERQCRGGVLDRYLFAWDQPGYVAAVVLGYGSIYNTCPRRDPNARFNQRWTTLDMIYRATRDIALGEQILVDYEWEDGEFDIPVPKPLPPSRSSRRVGSARRRTRR